MRKKAERQIRAAAARLGDAERYRLDRVREGAGLYPKVFDKTILDMARLGTVRLREGDSADLSPAELGRLVRRGETVYMWCSFGDAGLLAASAETAPPVAAASAKTDIVLAGVDAALWQRFEDRCCRKEGKPALQKLVEMMAAYLNE